jgi:hypothetical protein
MEKTKMQTITPSGVTTYTDHGARNLPDTVRETPAFKALTLAEIPGSKEFIKAAVAEQDSLDAICERIMAAFKGDEFLSDTDLKEASQASRPKYLDAMIYLLEETNEIYQDESDEADNLPYPVYRKTKGHRMANQD